MSEIAWRKEFAKKIGESKIPDHWELCVDPNLVKTTKGSIYAQHTFGSFRCSCCLRSWSSSKVSILFLLNQNKRKHGTVRMRIFKQGCESCIRPEENPTITAENIARVVYNLVNKIQKKFYGVNDQQDFQPKIYGSLEGPHNRERCEACRYGLCEQQMPSGEYEDHSGSDGPAVSSVMGLAIGIGAMALMYLANKYNF